MNFLKILDNHIEQLGDIFLENVVGGSSFTVSTKSLRIMSEVANCVGILSGIAAFGSQIGSTVYKSKAKKALDSGDKAKSNDFSDRARILNVASLTAGGLALGAITASAITYKINTPLRSTDSITEEVWQSFDLLKSLGL